MDICRTDEIYEIHADMTPKFSEHIITNEFPVQFMMDFLNRENQIYYRFQPPTVHGYVSEKYTALIMNLQEEFIEWKNSNRLLQPIIERMVLGMNGETQAYKLFDNYENNNCFRKIAYDTMLEIIDMICYLGTIMVSFDEKDLDYTEDLVKCRVFTYKKYMLPAMEINMDMVSVGFFHYYMTQMIPNNVEKIYREVIDELIQLRTNFKERKWHKPQVESDFNTKARVLAETNKVCFKSILLLMEQLVLFRKIYGIFEEDGKFYREFRIEVNDEVDSTIHNNSSYEFNEYFRIKYDDLILNKVFEMIFDKQQVTLDLPIVPIKKCEDSDSISTKDYPSDSKTDVYTPEAILTGDSNSSVSVSQGDIKGGGTTTYHVNNVPQTPTINAECSAINDK